MVVERLVEFVLAAVGGFSGEIGILLADLVELMHIDRTLPRIGRSRVGGTLFGNGWWLFLVEILSYRWSRFSNVLLQMLVDYLCSHFKVGGGVANSRIVGEFLDNILS